MIFNYIGLLPHDPHHWKAHGSFHDIIFYAGHVNGPLEVPVENSAWRCFGKGHDFLGDFMGNLCDFMRVSMDLTTKKNIFQQRKSNWSLQTGYNAP